jgi:hypothetical protein
MLIIVKDQRIIIDTKPIKIESKILGVFILNKITYNGCVSLYIEFILTMISCDSNVIQQGVSR